MRRHLLFLAVALVACNSAKSASCASGKGLTSPYELNACCPISCGSCGGKGCGARPGGDSACCGSNILAKNSACGTPPCVIKPDQGVCKSGLLNGDKSVCCSSKCGALCGKKGCSAAGGGEKGCCATAIQASGRLCSNNAALPSATQGCILKTASTPPTTKPTSGGRVCDRFNPRFVPDVGCVALDPEGTCSGGSGSELRYLFTEADEYSGGSSTTGTCPLAADLRDCFRKDGQYVINEASGPRCADKRIRCPKSGLTCGPGQLCVNEQCACTDKHSVKHLGVCLKKCGVDAAKKLPTVCVRNEVTILYGSRCVSGKCQCEDTAKFPLTTCPVTTDAAKQVDFVPQTCYNTCDNLVDVY